MTAETLGIALLVLVGATVLSMVREFLREPWYLQEGFVVVESTDQIPSTQAAVAYAQPRALPANVHALAATASPVERPIWLDSTQPIPALEPESVPA